MAAAVRATGCGGSGRLKRRRRLRCCCCCCWTCGGLLQKSLRSHRGHCWCCWRRYCRLRCCRRSRQSGGGRWGGTVHIHGLRAAPCHCSFLLLLLLRHRRRLCRGSSCRSGLGRSLHLLLVVLLAGKVGEVGRDVASAANAAAAYVIVVLLLVLPLTAATISAAAPAATSAADVLILTV